MDILPGGPVSGSCCRENLIRVLVWSLMGRMQASRNILGFTFSACNITPEGEWGVRSFCIGTSMSAPNLIVKQCEYRALLRCKMLLLLLQCCRMKFYKVRYRWLFLVLVQKNYYGTANPLYFLLHSGHHHWLLYIIHNFSSLMVSYTMWNVQSKLAIVVTFAWNWTYKKLMNKIIDNKKSLGLWRIWQVPAVGWLRTTFDAFVV